MTEIALDRSDYFSARKREVQALHWHIAQMRRWGGGSRPAPIHHLIAFDAGLYSRHEPVLSGHPYQSNAANLYDQARSAAAHLPGFYADYLPGIGTSEASRQVASVAGLQSASHRNMAELAYQRLVERMVSQRGRGSPISHAPWGISVSLVALGRGQISAFALAERLSKDGLVGSDGRQFAPPGVPVRGMVLLAPLLTAMDGAIAMPANVEGPVLVVRPRDGPLAPFVAFDYATESRVYIAELGLQHVGLVGGSDLHGMGAAVLEGATAYLQRCGVPLSDVPAHRQFIPGQVGLV